MHTNRQTYRERQTERERERQRESETERENIYTNSKKKKSLLGCRGGNLWTCRTDFETSFTNRIHAFCECQKLYIINRKMKTTACCSKRSLKIL